MAKGSWISDQERERILTLRNAGVPVSDIAKQTQRSTNYIYRFLRKVNGHVPTKRKPKTATVSYPPAADAESVEDPASDVGTGSRLLDRLTEVPNDELLCSVEGMDVSACEPIPMPRSMQESELQQIQTQAQVQVEQAVPVTVIAGVGFNATHKPQDTARNDEFSPLGDESPSTARSGRITVTQAVGTDQVPPSKKPKTSSLSLETPVPGHKTAVPASSSLVVNFRLPRSQTTESLALSNIASSDGLGGLLQRIQDEIHRLESLDQADLYDALLLQTLVKFHAELLLMQIQKMYASIASSKRSREEDSGGKGTSHLLREKLEKEIALLNIQADREKLELERDQIRHKAAAMLCRTQLLGANGSPTDLDQLFPRQ